MQVQSKLEGKRKSIWKQGKCAPSSKNYNFEADACPNRNKTHKLFFPIEENFDIFSNSENVHEEIAKESSVGNNKMLQNVSNKTVNKSNIIKLTNTSLVFKGLARFVEIVLAHFSENLYPKQELEFV